MKGNKSANLISDPGGTPPGNAMAANQMGVGCRRGLDQSHREGAPVRGGAVAIPQCAARLGGIYDKHPLDADSGRALWSRACDRSQC